MKRRQTGKAGKWAALIWMGILSAMLLCACGKRENASADGNGGSAEAASESESESRVFGTFRSETLDGEAVTQEILEGTDLTMVNIWATFCRPCISEMPDLAALNEEYADRGFQVVGIISDVTQAGDETAGEIVSMTGADYTHIVASDDLRSGFLRIVNVVPTTIFLDREGKRVGETYSGSRSKEGWAEIIELLMEETSE